MTVMMLEKAGPRALAQLDSLLAGVRLPSHTAPVGTLSIAQGNRVGITMEWSVQNTGQLAGNVAGHIIIQERGLGGENSVVEADVDPATGSGRVRTKSLSAPLGSLQRNSIVWQPDIRNLAPGATAVITAYLLVGMDLLQGKSDLDIVSIVDALPDVKGIAEHRDPDLFAVAVPSAFKPASIGEPKVKVFAS